MTNIDRRFTRHRAATTAQNDAHAAMHDAFHTVATHIDTTTHPTRESQLALTHLETALMWANKAIDLDYHANAPIPTPEPEPEPTNAPAAAIHAHRAHRAAHPTVDDFRGFRTANQQEQNDYRARRNEEISWANKWLPSNLRDESIADWDTNNPEPTPMTITEYMERATRGMHVTATTTHHYDGDTLTTTYTNPDGSVTTCKHHPDGTIIVDSAAAKGDWDVVQYRKNRAAQFFDQLDQALGTPANPANPPNQGDQDQDQDQDGDADDDDVECCAECDAYYNNLEPNAYPLTAVYVATDKTNDALDALEYSLANTRYAFTH